MKPTTAHDALPDVATTAETPMTDRAEGEREARFAAYLRTRRYAQVDEAAEKADRFEDAGVKGVFPRVEK